MRVAMQANANRQGLSGLTRARAENQIRRAENLLGQLVSNLGRARQPILNVATAECPSRDPAIRRK
jgi:hypothetical protein